MNLHSKPTLSSSISAYSHFSSSHFIVIDTEGSPILSEIAIIDSQGQLIYEAYTATDKSKLHSKPLAQVLQDFLAIALTPQPKTIVCHFAEHDRQILKNSCRKAGINWQELTFVCTVELSQRLFPSLASYSLAHLSRYFRLSVDNKLFNSRFAHASRYDAIFTHQLYHKLQSQSVMNMLKDRLQSIPNPFTSSRVDNPFQHHIDLQALYHGEYERLKSILVDIKRDANQQSRGAVVIGEAGSGKTHLMMRLATDLLKTNRLLFINQPNDASTVIYHTYARILGSFAEKIPETQHTQLDLLVANSFVNILSQSEKFLASENGKKIFTILSQNPLKLYDYRANTANWKSIELNIVRWWEKKYNAAGYSGSILKGILKFCSYVDPNLKSIVRRWLAGLEIAEEDAQKVNLENWSEEISREEFALEAIAVFGKLSTLDEPLIIVFDQLEGLSNKPAILSNFGDAVKEILTVVPNSLVILNLFPDRWQQFQTVFDNAVIDRFPDQVHLPRPSQSTLREILQAKIQDTTLDLGEIFESKELENILSQKSIRAVLNRAADYYRYKVSNIPLPTSSTSSTIPNPNEPNLNESRWNYVEQEIAQLKQAITQIQQTLSNTSSAHPLIQNSNNQTENISQPVSPTCQLLSQPVSQPEIPQHNEIKEYIQRKQSELGKDYDRPHIIFDADDLGKLAQILESFQLLQDFEIDQMRLGNRVLPEHFQFKIKDQEYMIGFLHIGSSGFTTRIKNLNELVINHPRTKFYLLRDAREPAITGRGGKESIEKLRYTQNGDFLIMDKGDRLNFDLIYDLIIDIKNKDLDVDLKIALQLLSQELKDYWLIKIIAG
jgi:DNA polymerase III epsilon subunit-like protein/GTPase SAR1 family protein